MLTTGFLLASDSAMTAFMTVLRGLRAVDFFTLKLLRGSAA